jgi:hypothetical protein
MRRWTSQYYGERRPQRACRIADPCSYRAIPTVHRIGLIRSSDCRTTYFVPQIGHIGLHTNVTNLYDWSFSRGGASTIIFNGEHLPATSCQKVNEHDLVCMPPAGWQACTRMNTCRLPRLLACHVIMCRNGGVVAEGAADRK